MTDARQMDRLSALKHEFDRAFASPRLEPTAAQSCLVIRVDGDQYALRLSDVKSVHLGRVITAVPSPRRELRGLAAFRGALAPIYDLRLLLGYRGDNADVQARCLLLLRAETAVGLCFDAFDSHVRAVDAQLAAAPATSDDLGGHGGRAHVLGALRVGDVLIPLLDGASLLAAVAKLSSHTHDKPPKE